MAVTIQVRRDTAANWISVNPTLKQGEWGYETDTGKVKIGDGTSTWAALGYSGSKYESLGTFDPSLDIGFSTQGYYNPHTMTGDETWNFTNIVDGITQWIKITTDGTHTLTIGTNGEIFIGSAGQLKQGTYKIGLGTPFGDGVVQVNIPGTEIATQLSTPVITASSQDAAIRIVFSSEDVNSTGRELYRSTVNDVQTASSVAGFDGTADYVDDNNGAGLTNGTTYYYWGRNTAPGYTNSAYATDSAAPSAGVTQLTQPTGLTATGGNNTVALAYDAIDANADDVAVQRSLTSGSGFATIATISRALTSYDDNTAVNGTTYYYRLIANGSGSYSNSNPSAEASATPSTSIIIMQDDFAGTTINTTTKWDLFNPQSPYPDISQNEQLIINSVSGQGQGTLGDNYLRSKNTFSSGAASITYSSITNNQYSLFQFGIYADINNRAILQPAQTTGLQRFYITVGGSLVYSYLSTIVVYGKRWKVVIEANNDIKAFYWDGSQWVQDGVTQNYDIGAVKYAGFNSIINQDSATSEVHLDDFYQTSENYSTQIPV